MGVGSRVIVDSVYICPCFWSVLGMIGVFDCVVLILFFEGCVGDHQSGMSSPLLSRW